MDDGLLNFVGHLGVKHFRQKQHLLSLVSRVFFARPDHAVDKPVEINGSSLKQLEIAPSVCPVPSFGLQDSFAPLRSCPVAVKAFHGQMRSKATLQPD